MVQQPTLSEHQAHSYLARIGFFNDEVAAEARELPEPNLATLTRISALHPMTVTFENLSIIVPEWRELDMTPQGLKLDVEHVYTKVVDRKRGGYCFELNNLLAALLRALGYTVQTSCSKVVIDGMTVVPQEQPDHRYSMTQWAHKILFVSGGKLPEGDEYVADVGLGGNTLTCPVKLKPEHELAQEHTWDGPQDKASHQYRLRWGVVGSPQPVSTVDKDGGYYMQIWANRDAHGSGAWHDLFFFRRTVFDPADYHAANYVTSTMPNFIMTTGPFCSRPDASGGRYILLNKEFKYRNIHGESTSEVVESDERLAQILEDHFNIQLPAPVKQVA